MRIQPLAEHHRRTAFSSGVESIDRYFKIRADQDVRKRVASCFVLIDTQGTKPLGFYTLAATSIIFSDLPETIARRFPCYPTIRATLMGRLAVDRSCRGQGYGQLLLMDALSRVIRNEIAALAFVVDVNNDAAFAFYSAHSFEPFTANGQRMYIPMAEVAELFS